MRLMLFPTQLNLNFELSLAKTIYSGFQMVFKRFYKLDVSSRDACFAAVAQVVADFGKVHHLVNCVAYFGSQSLLATETDWQKTLSVNVMGSSFMVQAVVEQMKNYSLTENCSVVNMSSISAHQTQPNR